MEANRALIPFNMIFDTEVGLINCIGAKYLDPEEFEDGLFNLPDGITKYFLKQRPMKNPLGEYTVREEDADFYYNEFIKKKYDEILEYSVKTTLFTMVEKMLKYPTSISITILCDTIEEVDIVNEAFNNKVSIICPDSYKDIDLRMYDSIYVKDVKDLFLYEAPLDGKNIYMSSHLHNFTFGLEEPVPDIEVTSLLLTKTDINIIDLYSEDEYIVPVG